MVPAMRRTALLILSLCLLPVLAVPAPAQTGALVTPRQQLNITISERHILPGYEALLAAGKTLHTGVDAFCAQPGQTGLEKAQAAFHTAMDAWMGVQHIRIGPAEQSQRNFRLQFWPDRRGIAARHLRTLLAKGDRSVLTADTFPTISVAVQGFPAMERLLFGESAQKLLAGNEADYRCAVLQAIAGNVENIAQGILDDWRGPAGFGHIIETAWEGNSRYIDNREALRDLFKGFHGGLETVYALKLLPVLGKELAKARPRRAESWRSARSLRNIAVNIAVLQKLYTGDGAIAGYILTRDPENDALDDDIRAAFDRTARAIDAIGMPLSAAVADPAARPRVEELAIAVHELSQQVSGPLADALDIGLGFNARDGD